MSNLTKKKTIAVAAGAAMTAGLVLSSMQASADSNPFAAAELSSGYMQLAGHHGGEGKCGEGKCGAADKTKEAKCGEGKCGEGKCGAADKAKEAKCGEGKCGEGKCGAH